MQINHNIAALNTQNQLQQNNSATQSSLEKLSSGMKINKAGDDAAGLAISEKMRGQINGLEMAEKNAQDGISMVQTAEGAMNESHAILQRMRELSVQSANDSNTQSDRQELQKEVDQLANALNDISEDTEFNEQNLLDGSLKATFQVGANEGQNLSVEVNDMSASALGVQNDTSGLQVEVSKTETAGDSAKSETGTSELAVADTESYDVVKLDEESTIGGNEYNFAMKNDQSEIVGLSDKGQNWNVVENGKASEDIDNFNPADIGGNGETFDMGNKITSGEIKVSQGGTNGEDVTLTGIATAQFEGSESLESGDYEVVDNSNAIVSGAGADVGLINGNGDLVATAQDPNASSQTFKDLNGNDLFELADGNGIDSTADKGETFTVAGKGGIDISSQEAADSAISTIQGAIDDVSAERSKLGAVQNRLDHTINNLSTSSENMTAAESRIRDTDMAKEMMEFTKNNILSQASQSMLAQAQQRPQGVLQLLQ